MLRNEAMTDLYSDLKLFMRTSSVFRLLSAPDEEPADRLNPPELPIRCAEWLAKAVADSGAVLIITSHFYPDFVVNDANRQNVRKNLNIFLKNL